MLALMRYMKGYLLVRLTGFSPERFLNLCSKNGIALWGLQYGDKGYEFYMGVDGFRKIRPLVRKSKTRLVILKKFGLPFFLHKNKKRKMFAVGVVLFAAVLYLMSIFIWDIHFEGTYSYTEDMLLKFLKENGIEHGILKNRISCEEIEQKLRNNYDEITWVSAQISGTRLIIKIRENYDLLKVEEKDTSPCDLVAARDGIITEMVVRTGIPQVAVGDVVKKGQVLVSGIVPITNDGEEVVATHAVRSDATIMAKTVVSYRDRFSLVHQRRVYTGKTDKTFYFKAFDVKGTVRGRRLGFKEYDSVVQEKQLRLFSNFSLPFYWGEENVREYISYEEIYTEEEARELSGKRQEYFIEKIGEKGVQIIENHVTILINGTECISEGTMTAVEPLGSEQAINYPEESEEGADLTGGSH